MTNTKYTVKTVQYMIKFYQSGEFCQIWSPCWQYIKDRCSGRRDKESDKNEVKRRKGERDKWTKAHPGPILQNFTDP